MTNKKKLQQLIDKSVAKLDVETLNQAMILNEELQLLDWRELEQVAGELGTAIGQQYDVFQDDGDGLVLIDVWGGDAEAERIAKKINQQFKGLSGLDVFAVVVQSHIHDKRHPDYAQDIETFVEVRVDADYIN